MIRLIFQIGFPTIEVQTDVHRVQIPLIWTDSQLQIYMAQGVAFETVSVLSLSQIVTSILRPASRAASACRLPR